MTYNAKNYTEQGGERTVIGGEIDVIAGGTLKIAGTAITASAAEINNAVAGVFGVATHSYGTGHADWTLSTAEQRATRLIATGTADAAVNAIAPATAGKMYIVLNTSGQALTIKATGQTGVEIASTKSAIVIGNGTDFVRVTADA